MVHKRTDRKKKKIAASCQIVADTLIMLKSHVIEGARISDLDNLAESFIISRGARPAFKGYMGFPSTLCVSVDSAVVHGVPNDDILREGQIVSIDCGAELDGYYGDHAISFPVGKVNANICCPIDKSSIGIVEPSGKVIGVSTEKQPPPAYES